MIKIVIVDDEVLVRQGIRSYIENANENIEIAGVFSNAKDAVSFLGQNSVHILITDIKMAQMDGIELIRHCVNSLYPMGIVVLSCYDNFAYAKSAFELGADAYLLKHEINQEELISVIKKVYVHYKQKHVPSPRNDVYDQPEDHVPCGNGSYAVAKMCFKARYEQFVRIEPNAGLKTILDVTGEILASNSMGKAQTHNGDILLYLVLGEHGAQKELAEKAETAAKHIAANIMNYFNERVYLAVSNPKKSADEFQTAAAQANAAANAAFYDNTRSLFLFCDLNNGTKNADTGFFTENIDMTCREWRSNVEADIGRYTERSRQSGLPSKYFKQNIQGFIYKLEDHLFRYYNTSLKQILPNISVNDYSLLEDMDNHEIVKSYVLYLIDSAMHYVAGIRSGEALFSRIKEHIDRHYADGITLTALSEHFHINQSYLCKLFKSNMDIGFVSYLNQVRICHAKRLLATSSLSIEEISERTGFNNSNYLIRVFKKVTGMTVGEYRKAQFRECK